MMTPSAARAASVPRESEDAIMAIKGKVHCFFEQSGTFKFEGGSKRERMMVV